jgi:hypothetical protein
LNKLSPSASKACNVRPPPTHSVRDPRGTRWTSSTYGGESTRSNTLSRSSSRRIPMDDPDGSTP